MVDKIDNSDLPAEVLAQLSSGKAEQKYQRIISVFDETGKNILSLDEILIHIYRSHGEIWKRTTLVSLIYIMMHKHRINNVPGSQGVYMLPTSEKLTVTDKTPLELAREGIRLRETGPVNWYESEAKDNYATLCRTLIELQGKVDRIAEWATIIESLQRELDTLSEKYADLSTQNYDLTRKLAGANNRLEEFVHAAEQCTDVRDELAKENASLQSQLVAAGLEVERLREALQYIVDCFGAAECEGILELLSDTDDLDLKDRVERRIYFAKDRALQAVEQPSPSVELAQAMMTFYLLALERFGSGYVYKPDPMIMALHKVRELMERAADGRDGEKEGG